MRDLSGREMFMLFFLEYYLIFGYLFKDFWFWLYDSNLYKEGFECCLDYVIIFYYINLNNMYVLEYMVYYFRFYGMIYDDYFFIEGFGGVK